MKLREIFSGASDTLFGYFELGSTIPWVENGFPANCDMLDVMLWDNFGEREISATVKRYAGDNVPIDPDDAKRLSAHMLKIYREKWDRISLAMAAEYNPISNYDMTETETSADEHSGTDTTTTGGTDTTTDSGTDTVTHSGTDTGTTVHGLTVDSSEHSKIYGFDSTAGADSDERTAQTVNSGTDSQTMTHGEQVDTEHGKSTTFQHGKTAALAHGEKVERERTLTRSGNIGVTTSAQMIGQELTLWQTKLWDIIVHDAAELLTIPIY